jgi:oxygen-independent coproporphyrinogen-3 oxidase
MTPIEIYIHIPFCVKKCLYCDFLSSTQNEHVQKKYFSALVSEIHHKDRLIDALECGYRPEERVPNRVRTVFFGGGTPSLPDSRFITGVLDALRQEFTFTDDAEITIEMNPGTVSYDKLCDYRKGGINRISIGCQSLNDSELKRLGRVHDANDFRNTFRDARKAGFDNINVDIMSALPGQSPDSYKETLQEICRIHPEHISAYSLIIEPGTPFYERYQDAIDRDLHDVEDRLIREGIINDGLQNRSENSLPSEDEERQMYEDTFRILTANGYHRYEISNYASDEGMYECRHNRVYWERGAYIGFGLGASGMYENQRWSDTDDLEAYIAFWNQQDDSGLHSDRQSYNELFDPEKMMTSLPVYSGYQIVDIRSQIEETMFLGLRESEGVSRERFFNTFGKELDAFYCDILPELTDNGLIIDDGHRIRLTEKGISLSNYVMSCFLLD